MPLSIFANKVQEKTEIPQAQTQSLVETERMGAQVAANVHSQGEKLSGIEGKMDNIDSSLGNALRDLDQIGKNQNSFGFSSFKPAAEAPTATDVPSTQNSTVTGTAVGTGTGTGSDEVQESPLKRIGNVLDPVLGLLNSDSVKRIMKRGDSQANGKEENAQVEGNVGTMAAVQNEQEALDTKVDSTSSLIKSATSRVEKLLKK